MYFEKYLRSNFCNFVQCAERPQNCKSASRAKISLSANAARKFYVCLFKVQGRSFENYQHLLIGEQKCTRLGCEFSEVLHPCVCKTERKSRPHEVKIFANYRQLLRRRIRRIWICNRIILDPRHNIVIRIHFWIISDQANFCRRTRGWNTFNQMDRGNFRLREI